MDIDLTIPLWADPQAAVAALREALSLALRHLDLHSQEYHHVSSHDHAKIREALDNHLPALLADYERMEGRIDSLVASWRASEDQLIAISNFLGKDARHVTEGETSIAGLVKQEFAEQAAEIEKLQRFKDWVHAYLDAKGIPAEIDGPHSAEGCRIGDRMDYVFAEIARLKAALAKARELSSPVTWTPEETAFWREVDPTP